MSARIIWTIAEVHLRCREVDGHWLWSEGTTAHGIPTARIDGVAQGVQRWVYKQTRTIRPKWAVIPSCDERTCCNPEHLRQQSRSAIGVAAERRPPALEDLRRRARLAGWYKLTDEQVEAIRSRPLEMTVRQAAEKWGVCRSTIHGIDSGKSHKKPAVVVASVFDLGRQAGPSAERREVARRLRLEQARETIGRFNASRKAA